MNINRNNYEPFFLDFAEGKLSPDQILELMEFLAANTDLENELVEFENVSVNPANINFSDKNSLKKTFSKLPAINKYSFNEYCIAHIENDLDEKSEQNFIEYLKNNPDKQHDLALYQKTKLNPDLSVQFERKNSLKHYSINWKSKVVYIIPAAAASITLLIYLMLPTAENKIPTTQNIQLSDNKVIIKHKVEKIETVHTVIPEKKTRLNRIEVISKPEVISNNEPVQIASLQRKEIKLLPDNNNYLIINNIKENTEVLLADNSDKHNLKDIAIEKIKSALPEKKIDTKELKTLSLYKLMKISIDKINDVTGSNITLNQYVDTTTNRKVTEFNAGLLSYSSVKKINDAQ